MFFLTRLNAASLDDQLDWFLNSNDETGQAVALTFYARWHLPMCTERGALIFSFFLPDPERPHAHDRSPDDGLHGGDDQHREGGGLRQALLHLQLLAGAALRPGGRHDLLDQQGSDCCAHSICWRLDFETPSSSWKWCHIICVGVLGRSQVQQVSSVSQVNMKMREITEREHKVKHHPLESPSHQKVKLLHGSS